MRNVFVLILMFMSLFCFMGCGESIAKFYDYTVWATLVNIDGDNLIDNADYHDIEAYADSKRVRFLFYLTPTKNGLIDLGPNLEKGETDPGGEYYISYKGKVVAHIQYELGENEACYYCAKLKVDGVLVWEYGKHNVVRIVVQ